MEALKNISDEELTPLALKEAFDRFSDASQKLEQKYELLLRETEVLRTRLEEKDKEVRKVERLAVLGETAAGIAHEVRNPLGAIRLFVSLLKQDLRDRPESLELAHQIEASVHSLDRVVSNILLFSKEESHPSAPVNVHSIIKEQILHFEKVRGTDMEYRAALHANPFVRGNEHSLRQVIYNLLLNSVQACRTDGCVQVATFDGENDELCLVIRDSGPGIPEELIGRIFEPFMTTKTEGTGLGLSIVKRIIEQHHGYIHVHNDQGAVFQVTIPRRRAS